MSEFWELFGEWSQDSGGDPVMVTVETYEGTGGWGADYAVGRAVQVVLFDGGRKLIRDATGAERLSTASLYVELGDDADLFTVGSRVSLPGGRTTTVLQVSAPDVFGLFGFKTVAME